MVYVPSTWNDNALPAIDAATMQKIEDGIMDAHDGKIDLSEPPAIGDTTPNTGNFTELDVSDTPITNSYWRSVHPFLDENYSNVKGVPTQVTRGLFRGYSFAIWSSPAQQYEELLFKMRVPFRWDGVTNPWFVAITSPSGAETADNRYQFQFEWQSSDIGSVLPDTICETIT